MERMNNMKPYFVENPNSKYVSLIWAEDEASAATAMLDDQDMIADVDEVQVWAFDAKYVEVGFVGVKPFTCTWDENKRKFVI